MTRILLVEDNPNDVRFVLEVLSESGRVAVDVVANGNDVIPDLERRSELPALVLLDLNLPGCRGEEVLRAIRARPRMAGLPVIVMTSSCAPEDVQLCYQAHANSFIVKPLEFDQFREAILSLERFWFDTATLPEV